MSSWGKRAWGSHSVQPSPMHRSRQFFVDIQAIITEQDVGYRPMFEDDHNAGHNPYSREAMAQGTSHIDDTPMYENADIEQMYSHPEVDVGVYIYIYIYSIVVSIEYKFNNVNNC